MRRPMVLSKPLSNNVGYPSLAETSSPDDLEDTSDKVYVSGGVDDEVAQEGEEEPEQLVDNVERIFVPEHKNQATSPSHPLAQPEEFVEAAAAAAASDAEVRNGWP